MKQLRILPIFALFVLIINSMPLNTVYAQERQCDEELLMNLQISIINCEGDSSCSVNDQSSIITMTSSEKIPEPHKSIIERAASAFSVNPNFVAALFLSEQGNVWKPIDSSWARSSEGASGPFQFMPGTWAGYKQDGNGDGVADIMNFEDAAYAAAKYASTGTKQNTPLGDINNPFQPNTLIYFSAAYNWGGGNLSKKTNASSPITAAPKETQNYMNNIYSLISSNFTRSGHPNYGNPRLPGQDSTTSPDDSSSTSSISSSCVSSGEANKGITTTSAATAKNIILSSPNIKWGNHGPASSQKNDVETCLTDTTLISFAAIASSSGATIPINALATDHGGCSKSGKSHHNHGRAIDIGYYGNGGQGQGRHKPEGDVLYKFLFDNRVTLKIDELIWQNPPTGYKCLNNGNVGECNTLYSAATMNQHYHHIHVSFID